MKKLITTLCAAAIAAPLGLSAAPAFAQSGPFFSDNLVQVRDNRHHRGRFERRGNRAYYNGQRGYRNHRRGYREYNGYWFPPAAFALGAIIGGAINNAQPRSQPRYHGRGLSQRHINWCNNRYRSYRASDNTFQPYHGSRRQCYSPYS